MNMSNENINKHQAINEKMINKYLSDQLEHDYIDFVKSRFGIVVKENNKDFIKTILATCDQYHLGPADFLNELRKAKDNSEVLIKLVAAITIGETYFFRDAKQINILSETLLPEIIERKKSNNDYNLRIWSAGCSSGEEIYTIVMLLKNILNDFYSWQYHFLATDINVEVLKKGMTGKYTEWSMRSIPEYYLKKYFVKHDGIYEITEDIKKYVTFDYLNLNSDNYPSILNGTISQDLIICRNVLMYFDEAHIKKILSNLCQCISDDGFIMLGASDPIFLTTNLVPVKDIPSLFVKHKQADTRDLKETDVHSNISTINLKQRPLITDYTNLESKKTLINELIAASKWDEIIANINQFSLIRELPLSYLLAKALALANLGHLADAIKICEDCLKLDGMNKEVYFIYALSLAECKKFKEAEAAFRKALYIDPDYLICRYQFGLFLIHLKKYKEGIKSLQNTINSARKFNPNENVPYFQKTSYQELIAILTNEINLYNQ